MNGNSIEGAGIEPLLSSMPFLPVHVTLPFEGETLRQSRTTSVSIIVATVLFGVGSNRALSQTAEEEPSIPQNLLKLRGPDH